MLLGKQNNDNFFIIDRTRIYLFIIILIGLILRIYNLGKFGLWFDESAQPFSFLHFKNKPLYFYFTNINKPLSVPFIILLKLWMNINSNDFFLRFFSVIWGTLSLIMIYRLGEFIFSKKIGILSALFLCISPLHIYYSQELTYYSLSLFLTLSSGYYFVKILKDPDRISSIMYVFFTLGSIYTHPVNLTFIVTQNLFFYFFYHKDKRLQKKWKYLQLIIFFLSLPYLYSAMFQFLKFSQSKEFFWIRKPSLKMLVTTFMVFSLGYHVASVLQLIAMVIFLYFLAKAIFYWHKKNEIFYFILWLLLPPCSIWLISQFRPLYLHRLFFFALPPFCLLMSAGTVKIKKYFEAGLIGFFVLLTISALKNYYENKLPYNYEKKYQAIFSKKDYKQAATYVSENFHDGDLILHICRSSYFPFIYYHQERFPEYGVKLNGICKEDWIHSWKNILDKKQSGKPKVLEVLAIKDKEELCGYKRIWLIHSSWNSIGRQTELPESDYVTKEIINWFENNFSKRETRIFEGINIYLFSPFNNLERK